MDGKELIKWLYNEKYLINEHSDKMTEEFEREHKWELSHNNMINKTMRKIEEMMNETFNRPTQPKETDSINYEAEYHRLQERIKEVLDENEKLKQALVNIALRL